MQGEDHDEDTDRAALRSYLQRGETRLSTVHRVAGVFLGGAGILTLLPLFFRDTVTDVIDHIVFLDSVTDPDSGAALSTVRLASLKVLLVGAISGSLLLALGALYLLLRDLVLFYFTGHHFKPAAGQLVDDVPGQSGVEQRALPDESRSYPRFILSGVLVPSDELSARAHASLREARATRDVLGLLVPAATASRRDVYEEARAVGIEPGDGVAGLGEFLFQYTASFERTLMSEAAKMEASLARHHRALRELVLRYAKSFLLTIFTTLTAIVGGALVSQIMVTGDTALRAEEVRGPLLATAVIYVVWAPAAIHLVRRPVRWIESTAGETGVSGRPRSLVRFETWAVATATVTGLLAAAAVWCVGAFLYADFPVVWVAAASLVVVLTIWFAISTFVRSRASRAGARFDTFAKSLD